MDKKERRKREDLDRRGFNLFLSPNLELRFRPKEEYLGRVQAGPYFSQAHAKYGLNLDSLDMVTLEVTQLKIVHINRPTLLRNKSKIRTPPSFPFKSMKVLSETIIV